MDKSKKIAHKLAFKVAILKTPDSAQNKGHFHLRRVDEIQSTKLENITSDMLINHTREFHAN